MKLRIRGDSLRLRLTQGEIAQLASQGRVEDGISFGPGARLIYALERANETRATFEDCSIVVRLSSAAAKQLFDDVGVEATQGTLRILIEKDFACLKPREGEDDSDAFPNPLPNPDGCA